MLTKDPDPVLKKPVKRHISMHLKEVSCISLLHFPQRPVPMDREVEFVIQRNGSKGEVSVKLLTPSGSYKDILVRIIDVDRLAVRFAIDEAGDHYVHVKYNGIPIPNSPFPISVVEQRDLRNFSYASLVKPVGLALKKIELMKWNDFRVDASEAGTVKNRLTHSCAEAIFILL